MIVPIWHKIGEHWGRLQPSGFPAESVLHDLVAANPELLPLSGSPQLVVVGREVALGSGYADLLAVDPAGQLAIIEIKLARNDEARRAIVSQVLSYAASLDKISYDDLELLVLASHLPKYSFSSLDATATAAGVDATSFRDALTLSLSEGRFRLVFVLDKVPDELARLATYLEGVTSSLVIDLIAIAMYDVGGDQIVVPHRVQQERRPGTFAPKPPSGVVYTDGWERFEAHISEAPPDQQATLSDLTHWARGLASDGLARLVSGEGVLYTSLQIRLPDALSLAVVYNSRKAGASLAIHSLGKWPAAPLSELEAALGEKAHDGMNVPISDSIRSAIRSAFEQYA